MIKELGDNIYSVYVPLPNNPLKNLNSYVIKTPDRNLIIDTGFNLSACFDALQTGLAELEIDMHKTDIFLTHLHADHTGLADRIAAPESKVYISGEDADFLRFIVNDKAGFYDLTKNRFQAYGVPASVFNDAVAANPAFHNHMDKILSFSECHDEDEIEVGPITLKCIRTPGHTPGHLCLYWAEKQYLFSGDHLLFDITPNITPWPSLPDSLGAYLDSLKKISNYKIIKTFAAHRENGNDVYARINELTAHHEARLESLYQIVKGKNNINTYEAASLLKWSIKADNWEDFPATQKFFALGETDAHLLHLTQSGRIGSITKNGINLYSVTK